MRVESIATPRHRNPRGAPETVKAEPPPGPDQNFSLPAPRRGIDRYLGLLLAASIALLLLGWLLPVMTVRTLLVFYDEVSILTGILRLLESGDILLFLLIALFTVVFPVAKLALAFIAWRRLVAVSPHLRRTLGWVETLGKWSMLDVFVVALLVVVIKVSMVSDVQVHVGLYVFATAALLSMFTVRRVVRLAQDWLHGTP